MVGLLGLERSGGGPKAGGGGPDTAALGQLAGTGFGTKAAVTVEDCEAESDL